MPSSATPQRADTDFGTLNVRSYPATARRAESRALEPYSSAFDVVHWKRASEGLASHRIAARAQKQRELLLAHDIALADLPIAERVESRPEPATGRRTRFGVVPRERR